MALPTAFDLYVAPAVAARGAVRVIAGVVLVTMVWLLWTIAVLLGGVAYNVAARGVPLSRAFESIPLFLTSGSPAAIIAVLSTFLGIWIGLWLALKLFHKRPFGTLFAPERGIRWREFLLGAGLAVAFFAVSMGAALVVVGAPSRSALPAGEWALWITPVVIGVFFQATAEELLFRGYLLQQLAAWSRNPIIWAILPSLFFGSLHLNPAEPLATNLMVGGITFLVGVVAAALVWRTGSLAAAMGLHVGVNCQALALVGAVGSPLGGAQLWLFDAADASALYVIDLISVIALLALVLSPWNPFGARAAPATRGAPRTDMAESRSSTEDAGPAPS